MKTLFKNSKVLIGMVHLKPMPGFPNSADNMDVLIDSALSDARALVRGGVDGLIVENIFNRPRQKTVGPETVAPMTLAVKAVVDNVDVPVGIKVLFNDYMAALAIAKCTGAKFVRISVYTDASVTMAGIIEGCAYNAVTYRRQIGAEHVKILADVFIKHAAPLAPVSIRPIEHVAYDTVNAGMAQGVVVTGPRTGLEINLDDLHAVTGTVGDRLLLVGSGASVDNIDRILQYADGAIVGTYFKKNGIIENPVDEERVRSLVKRVRG
jgi:membrane complex biogenesis BtpA family protein